jgi:hypothetical protein
MKELFAREALAQIPKILTLQDRNPHSPTYGCFDRNLWHYKIIDFPSGMAQESVWPLALACTIDAPGNPFFQQQAMREWIVAGILYAARHAHADGSCDDYFPYERAAGAAAFSLLACLEAYQRLGLGDDEMRRFFQKRADWLAAHEESGRLTNHQALIVLCLDLAGRVLRTDRWDEPKRRRLQRVFEWQNEEGWFQEYEGCDPGYHTVTISLLAQLHERAPSPELRASLERAVRFAAEFVHPDGSFGGEYTSRNTYNFFPHGFEIVGRWLPEALAINDGVLAGLAKGLGAAYGDDHLIQHHVWSYLLAFENYVAERPQPPPRPTGRRYFPNAGLLIDRRAGAEMYLTLNKGGSFKFFRDGRLVCSDTQWSLQVDEGRIRNAVGHMVGRYDTAVDADAITVRGRLGWAKQKQMTTFNLLVLRLIMLLGGRFCSDFIRRLLQKMLITGKAETPFEFERQLTWTDGRLTVRDRLRAPDWSKVTAAGLGSAQTSIYVVMSRTFQAGQLQPFHDVTAQVRQLGANRELSIEREF